MVALVAVVLCWDILRRQTALALRRLTASREDHDGALVGTMSGFKERVTSLETRTQALEREVKELAIRHDMSRPKLSRFQKGA